MVLDVGVAGPPPTARPAPGVTYLGRRVRAGTDDLSVGPAMSRDEALQAIGVGLAVADALAADGVELLGVGEMGIGNTTSASAIVAAHDRTQPGVGDRPRDRAGRGRPGTQGRDHRAGRWPGTPSVPDDPVGVLAAVGGLEIARPVRPAHRGGRGRPSRSCSMGSSPARRRCSRAPSPPDLPPRLFAGHRSVEPGHAVVLARLWRDPLLDLDLRLGEGTGAAMAMGIITAAVRLRDGMATFDDAAVSGPG